jgi:hypothetical protein
VLLVHAVGREGTDLDARALGVEQGVDALAGGHLALLVLLGDAFLAAALVDLVQALVEVGELQLVEVLVLGCFDVDGHLIRRSDDQMIRRWPDPRCLWCEDRMQGAKCGIVTLSLSKCGRVPAQKQPGQAIRCKSALVVPHTRHTAGMRNSSLAGFPFLSFTRNAPQYPTTKRCTTDRSSTIARAT